MTPASIIHIAGAWVRVGNRRRQRCAWCGALLEDLDYERTAIALPPGKTEEQARADGDLDPATWEAGALVEVWDGVKSIVNHEDGDELPPNACAQIDDEVTR